MGRRNKWVYEEEKVQKEEQHKQQSKSITCLSCSLILTTKSKILSAIEYAAKRDQPGLTDAERQRFFDFNDSVWICEVCLSHNKIPQNFGNQTVQKEKDKKFSEYMVKLIEILNNCIEREDFETARTLIRTYHSQTMLHYAKSISKIQFEDGNNRLAEVEVIINILSSQKSQSSEASKFPKSQEKIKVSKTKPILKASKHLVQKSKRRRMKYNQSGDSNQSLNIEQNSNSRDEVSKSDLQQLVLKIASKKQKSQDSYAYVRKYSDFIKSSNQSSSSVQQISSSYDSQAPSSISQNLQDLQ